MNEIKITTQKNFNPLPADSDPELKSPAGQIPGSALIGLVFYWRPPRRWIVGLAMNFFRRK